MHTVRLERHPASQGCIKQIKGGAAMGVANLRAWPSLPHFIAVYTIDDHRVSACIVVMTLGFHFLLSATGMLAGNLN